MKRASAELACAGFSLIEAMAALALTAMIITSLGAVAAQWIPNWGRGFVRLQGADLLGGGVERIAADLSAAEFVTQLAAARSPEFQGEATSVVFVRSAIGPNAYPHLEFVRLSESRDSRGFAMVRTSAPFVPAASDGSTAPIVFKDPVVLVRTPFRITFSYAGADNRVWLGEWKNRERLPAAVRVTVRDDTGRRLSASTAVRIRVTAVAAPAAAATPAKTDANASKTAPAEAGPMQGPLSGGTSQQ